MYNQNPTSRSQTQEIDGLDHHPAAGGDAAHVPHEANQGELARRLLGAGRRFSPERGAVAELIAERGGGD